MKHPTEDVAAPPALVGREAELGAIGECLRDARAGRGSVVLVEGRRGFGKSRMLHEASAAATAAGFRTGTGVAVQGDEALSMTPLMSALFDAPTPVLHRDLVADATPTPDAYRLLHRLVVPLEAAARTQPVLIAIDDAQWADAGTIAALRVLPHRLGHVPIVWVIAFRDLGTSPQLMDLVAHLNGRGAETLLLHALDDAAVAQLAAGIVRTEPAAELLQFAAQAGGTPALVVDLLHGLAEDELLRIEAGRAHLADARVPQRVCAMTREHLARLSPLARRAAAVASILGASASFDHLAAMLDVAPASLLGPVEELVRADLMVDVGHALGFRNELLRAAVMEIVPPAARRALQRQAVGVLLDAGASPVGPAMNLASSAEPGDRRVISTLIAAARALAASDTEAAADLSRRAFDLATVGDEVRAPLVAELALLLHAAGRAEEGKALVDDALRDTCTPEAEAHVRLSVARMPDLAPDVRTEAGRAALARPGLPEDLRARHLAEQVGNLAAGGRLDLAKELLERVEATVTASGDSAAALALDAARVQLAYIHNTFQAALGDLEVPCARPRDEHGLRFELLRAELLLAVDEFDSVQQLATDGIAAAARARRSSDVTAWHRVRGRCMLQSGCLFDAGVTLEGVFTAQSSHAVVNVSDAAVMVALGRVAIHLGDSRRARSLAKLAEGVVASGAPEMRRHAAWLLALAAMADGDAKHALAHLSELGEDGDASMLPTLMIDTADFPQLVRIALDAGDDELARATVAAAEARSRSNPGVRSIAAVVAHARGLRDGDASVLAEAVSLFADGPRRLAHASALEDYGIALVRAGDRTDGIDALGRALQLYSSHAAAWDASRVRRRLRDLGVRRRIVKAVRPTTGWAGLTDAEVAVVRLVAEGLTNREVADRLFVSPHTVSMHLRHVFTKLEIGSRVELTRLAFQHDQAA